jgi:hypothetical protein
MTEYLSAHPGIITILVIFVIIFILYFVFKQFIKLALIMFLIFLVVAGVFYFQDPGKTAERIKLTVDTLKAGTTEIIEKSKSFFKDSKELIKKTKEVPGDVNKLLKAADELQKK